MPGVGGRGGALRAGDAGRLHAAVTTFEPVCEGLSCCELHVVKATGGVIYCTRYLGPQNGRVGENCLSRSYRAAAVRPAQSNDLTWSMASCVSRGGVRSQRRSEAAAAVIALHTAHHRLPAHRRLLALRTWQMPVMEASGPCTSICAWQRGAGAHQVRAGATTTPPHSTSAPSSFPCLPLPPPAWQRSHPGPAPAPGPASWPAPPGSWARPAAQRSSSWRRAARQPCRGTPGRARHRAQAGVTWVHIQQAAAAPRRAVVPTAASSASHLHNALERGRHGSEVRYAATNYQRAAAPVCRRRGWRRQEGGGHRSAAASAQACPHLSWAPSRQAPGAAPPRALTRVRGGGLQQRARVRVRLLRVGPAAVLGIVSQLQAGCVLGGRAGE